MWIGCGEKFILIDFLWDVILARGLGNMDRLWGKAHTYRISVDRDMGLRFVEYGSDSASVWFTIAPRYGSRQRLDMVHDIASIWSTTAP